MSPLKELCASLLHLAFPHVCSGCGSDLLPPDHMLCLHCRDELPQTFFHMHANNPVEKIFWGRLPVTHATAQYYFTQGSLIQHLLHHIKYRRDQDLGWYLGRMMGYQLAASNRFACTDALVPLPLFPSRERKRGFNQATIICNGIAAVLQKPVLHDVVARVAATESQTKKSRIERWQNMEGRFLVKDACALEGRHVVLVDDVITTGATLEACGNALLQAANLRLSMATLCFSSG